MSLAELDVHKSDREHFALAGGPVKLSMSHNNLVVWRQIEGNTIVSESDSIATNESQGTGQRTPTKVR